MKHDTNSFTEHLHKSPNIDFYSKSISIGISTLAFGVPAASFWIASGIPKYYKVLFGSFIGYGAFGDSLVKYQNSIPSAKSVQDQDLLRKQAFKDGLIIGSFYGSLLNVHELFNIFYELQKKPPVGYYFALGPLIGITVGGTVSALALRGFVDYKLHEHSHPPEKQVTNPTIYDKIVQETTRSK